VVGCVPTGFTGIPWTNSHRFTMKTLKTAMITHGALGTVGGSRRAHGI
jgi:hypothetical protein